MPKDDDLKPTHARIDKAAAYGGLTRAQIYKLVNAGEIAAAKVGRATLIKLSTLDAYLERQRITSFPTRDEMKRRRKVHVDRMRRQHSPINGDAQ